MVAPEANDIKEFDQLPHLKKCINGDPIETLRAMATADLLVMSRSDFSYTAAILNKKGIIVYHPFWHGTPMEWIDGSHQRSFPERLLEACSNYQRTVDSYVNPSTPEHHVPRTVPKIPCDNCHGGIQHRA